MVIIYQRKGWLGATFFRGWDREEVRQYAPMLSEQFGSEYSFFGTDGGGAIFGFIKGNENVIFMSAPNIGSVEDIKNIGSWIMFLNSLEAASYI